MSLAFAEKAATKAHGYGQKSAFSKTFVAPVMANLFPFYVTPYLSLRAKLSQIWINRWTVLLLLVLVRTLISIAGLRDDMSSARREALSACSGVESAGSALASMPHYMSQGVNQLTAEGVEKAINGLMTMLTLTVTGVEELVVFVINMMTSTYVCLITLVVRGSLHAALELIQSVSDFLNEKLPAIGDDIQGAVNTFEGALNDVIDGLNGIGGLFGDDTPIPTLDLGSEIDALKNLQLPAGLDADLAKLNDSIPTFAEVNNFTSNVIRFPFEQIKTLINESTVTYTFDRSVFPVPAKERLAFCSDDNGINDFFDHLVGISVTARKIAIAVLVILAVLVCVPMAYREVRRHRIMERRAAEWQQGPTQDPSDFAYRASRPFTASTGWRLSRPFKSTRRKALVRWAVAYATTVPALFVLSLGIAGLFSCLCRYTILVAVQKEVPELTDKVANFADKVVDSLNNASTAWADGTNSAILDINTQINADVFGWVNTSTHAVNETLNVFINETTAVLNTTFGGTILYDPIQEIFNCLIGLKVASVQKGLTWVHDHAHVDFPLLPADTFSLGAAASLAGDGNSTAESFLADPSGGTSDGISAVVEHLVDRYHDSIRTEALISAGIVGVWVLVALAGVLRAVYLFYGHQPDADRGATLVPGFVVSSPSFVSSSAPVTAAPYVRREKTPPGSGPGEAGDASNAANLYSSAAYTLKPAPAPQFKPGTPRAL